MLEDNEDSNTGNTSHSVSPSVFLQNLTAKVNGLQVGSTNSVADVQRARTELSNQVQSVSNKQEMQIRQLDSQISMLQQEMRPKLQNIERQQGFAQKQLEEIRQRAQKLQMDDLAPLQYKFDQMGNRFDRFMRVELESKLKPLQDDLRQSRAKLDELSSTINSSFRKIDDQVNEMTQKVKTLNMNINSQRTNYEDQFNSIEPRLDSLEREINELSSTLNINAVSSINDDRSVGLTNQLNQIKLSVNRLQNDTIPITINESSTNLIDALENVSQFCDEKLSSLQSSLDSISFSNQAVDHQRQQSEEQLDQLLRYSYENKNKLDKIDQDSKSQLLMIEQAIDSNGSNLRSLLSDLTSEVGGMNGKTENSVDDDLKQLKNSIQASIGKLREIIRVSSQGNLEAQLQMLDQLSQLKNILYGKENAIGRMEAAELRLKWVVESIQEIDNERLEAQKANGGPSNLSIRFESMEERLAALDSRLNAIQPKNKANSNTANNDQKNGSGSGSGSGNSSDDDDPNKKSTINNSNANKTDDQKGNGGGN